MSLDLLAAQPDDTARRLHRRGDQEPPGHHADPGARGRRPRPALLELGVDSLIALELLFVVDREFAVRFELDELLTNMDISLAVLAAKLDERTR